MNSQPTIDFYFDYASPYAYIGNFSLNQKLPNANICYKPIYLRGLEAFRNSIPFVPNKLKNMIVDLARCADELELPLRIPDSLPINGIYACRGALYALEHGGFKAYHQEMLSAAWTKNIDISDKNHVIDIAVLSGQNRDAFSAGIDDQALKEDLKRKTVEAEKLGLFGVPSFIVDGELFWGADRINHLKSKMTSVSSI